MGLLKFEVIMVILLLAFVVWFTVNNILPHILR